MQNVLIAGGTGLIGNRLKQHLLKKGYSVSILTREKPGLKEPDVIFYEWKSEEHIIPAEAVLRADHVINLAGASISGRWTKEYKEIILKSRLDATTTIVNSLNECNNYVKTFISGSAIGYYGYDHAETLDEGFKKGTGFLADVCWQWEAEAKKATCENTRVIISRTGIVLALEGGALPQMATPVKYFSGAPLGSGRQYISWIHIDDLCRIYIHLIENEKAEGVFNIVTPGPVTNADLTKAIAKALHKPLWLPNIPGFMLKIILGEMADSLLGSLRIVPDKAIDSGFEFSYPTLQSAIENLLSNKRA